MANPKKTFPIAPGMKGCGLPSSSSSSSASMASEVPPDYGSSISSCTGDNPDRPEFSQEMRTSDGPGSPRFQGADLAAQGSSYAQVRGVHIFGHRLLERERILKEYSELEQRVKALALLLAAGMNLQLKLNGHTPDGLLELRDWFKQVEALGK